MVGAPAQAPASAEELPPSLAALPQVRAALVRGEADPAWGQAVTAYVVPVDVDPDPVAEAEAIRAALRNRLAAYKIPKRVILVAGLGDVPPPG